jgi:protein subunit release factor B
MSKEKILTVTIHDCEVQTFRAGGKGGQNQNKRDTGVRIIHHPSGARGESREERSQLQNKKAAFERMSKTPQFKYWVEVQTKRIESDEAYLERQMKPENFKLEVKKDGKWVEADESMEQAGIPE